MAKNSTGTKNPSRIRFIMVEAELGDGDVASVTQAITNALRGAQAPVKRIASPAPQQQHLNGNGEQHDEEELLDENTEVEALDVTPAPKNKGPRKPAPTPEILELDFTSQAVPLATFVDQYKFDSHQQRYLVASAWFNDHGGVKAVTPAHIYTVYRYLKWPLTLKDFSQTLRDLKKDQLYGSSEKGTYTINHVGLQRVAEMKS